MLALAVSTLAFTLAQTVEVRLAPDQPAPLFFVDEPLVVQVRADARTTIALHIDVDLPDGRRAAWKPGTIALEPGRAQWLTMDGLPALRGPHVFHIHTAEDAPPVERSLARIDRPSPTARGSLILKIESPSAAARYAAQCLGAGIQLPAEMPELESEAAAFAHPARGPIYVQITASTRRHPRSVESTVAALRERVGLWTVTGAISPRESIREAFAARHSDPAAAWAPRIAAPRDLAAILRWPDTPLPAALVCAAASAGPIADAAARAGFERMPLVIDLAGDQISMTLQALLRRILAEGLGPGRTALVPQRLVETPIGFSGALSALAAARDHFAGAQSLGVYAGAGENAAWILRPGPSAVPHTWIIVLMRSDPSIALPPIAPGDGAVWELSDAYGNPLADIDRGSGRVVVPAGGGVWYVRGHGGTLLREALAARIRATAQANLVRSGELAIAAPEAAGALEALAQYELPAPTRLQFFALLRALPAIEESWRRGVVETRDAIPLVRDLAAIAESLAVLEHELDEPLLEPLEKTLDTCAEWLARFPATPSTDPHDVVRLAYLRGEVFRLVERARAWQAAGRRTEAKAVAAIAEWRARSLEAAATIPWPVATDEPAAEEAAAPEETADAVKSESPEPEVEE